MDLVMLQVVILLEMVAEMVVQDLHQEPVVELVDIQGMVAMVQILGYQLENPEEAAVVVEVAIISITEIQCWKVLGVELVYLAKVPVDMEGRLRILVKVVLMRGKLVHVNHYTLQKIGLELHMEEADLC
tara:strand:- start:82 stop:468 length:387 start_codon:yes stop_codon:yes gene_type:complete